MKSKTIDEIIAIPDKLYEANFPISDEATVYLIFKGPVDKSCFDRLRDIVNLLETSILGKQQKITVAVHASRETRLNSTALDKLCAEMGISRGYYFNVRNKARIARGKTPLIYSVLMRCPSCDTPNVRLWRGQGYTSSAWFHDNGTKVPCLTEEDDTHPVPDREYGEKMAHPNGGLEYADTGITLQA